MYSPQTFSYHPVGLRANEPFPLAQPVNSAWFRVGATVGSLILAGTVFAFLVKLPSLSFSARASMVYVSVASLLILLVGWSKFPLAAGLFYGYLGLGQATSATFFVAGNETGAITLEMVLALPLLLTGLLGPRAPGRPLPGSIQWTWWLLLFGALASTVMATSMSVAAPTFLGRFLIPIAVTLVTYRRLRNVDEYMIVWFAFAVGFLAITAFGFRRAVLGVQADVVSQRWLGLAGSAGVPAVFVTGVMLWLGSARAENKQTLRGVFWIGTAGVLALLCWLSGGRAPTSAIALLVIWWGPVQALRGIQNPRILLLMTLGAVLVIAIVVFSLSRTSVDVRLVYERMIAFEHRGFTGESRWRLWTEGLHYWAQRPLLGVGPNNWIVHNAAFASVHGSLAGVLVDTGIVGFCLFNILFWKSVLLLRKSAIAALPQFERRFISGCRAGWLTMMAMLCVYLPFTSGQPQNNIFAYLVFMFPLLAMVAYSRGGVSIQPSATPQFASGYASSPRSPQRGIPPASYTP